jgi:RHS repeat-associated protein
MTSVVTNGGETTVGFGYDDANRQIFEDQTLTGYATHRISTPRDADGNRQWLDAAGINHMVYQYNERNQLAHILNGSVDPFYDFSYDPAGNETQRQSRVWYTSVSNFAYDELNRVTMGEQGTSGWIFARSWYQYDRAGRELATWRDENHGLGSQRGERFGYAADNQVVSVVYDANNVWAGGTPSAWTRSVGYGYSADTLNRASVNDNGVVTSYLPNALNQYQTFNGTTYNYDYNFNLREAPNWWGVFDAESRLTMAGGGGSVASFTYDGLGRCVRRIVYPPGGGSNTVIYAYDGWKPVLEFDAAGNYRASNIYGAGADEILFRWDTTYGGSIYKEDRHGNVVAVLDQWGNIAERYSYDAFGKAKIMSWWDNNERTTSWIGNRFMFQGREWLGEFGIYDYRHRMYNPGLGRFIQTDPMGLQTEGEKLSAGQKALFSPGGSAPDAFSSSEMNLFRYCGDDPVDGSDPTGLIENSDNNLQRRDRIDEIAKKYEGSHKYDFSNRLDNAFKELVNKCARFVNDIAREAGATAPTVKDSETGKSRSATAGELATQKFKDWRILKPTESAQRGDIGAYSILGQREYTGHAGIITSGIGPGLDGRSILSNQSVHGNDGVYPASTQFDRSVNPSVVIQRYTGE